MLKLHANVFPQVECNPRPASGFSLLTREKVMKFVSSKVTSRSNSSSASIEFKGDGGESITIDLRDLDLEGLSDDEVINLARDAMCNAGAKPDAAASDHELAGVEQTLDQP
jgi:hypothetical protein